jgi:hypothetical protein
MSDVTLYHVIEGGRVTFTTTRKPDALQWAKRMCEAYNNPEIATVVETAARRVDA